MLKKLRLGGRWSNPPDWSPLPGPGDCSQTTEETPSLSLTGEAGSRAADDPGLELALLALALAVVVHPYPGVLQKQSVTL